MTTRILSVEIPAAYESYLLDVLRRAMAELDAQPEWARDRRKVGTLRLTLEHDAALRMEDAAA